MGNIHLLCPRTTARAAEHVLEARRNRWLSRTHVGVQYLVFRNDISRTQRRPILPPATTGTRRSLASDWLALLSPQYPTSRWWICDPTGQRRPFQSRAPRPTTLIDSHDGMVQSSTSNTFVAFKVPKNLRRYSADIEIRDERLVYCRRCSLGRNYVASNGYASPGGNPYLQAVLRSS